MFPSCQPGELVATGCGLPGAGRVTRSPGMAKQRCISYLRSAWSTRSASRPDRGAFAGLKGPVGRSVGQRPGELIRDASTR
jgi:hypothetical protein